MPIDRNNRDLDAVFGDTQTDTAAQSLREATERLAKAAEAAADSLNKVPSKLLNRNFSAKQVAQRAQRLKALKKRRRARTRAVAKRQAANTARQQQKASQAADRARKEQERAAAKAAQAAAKTERDRARSEAAAQKASERAAAKAAQAQAKAERAAQQAQQKTQREADRAAAKAERAAQQAQIKAEREQARAEKAADRARMKAEKAAHESKIKANKDYFANVRQARRTPRFSRLGTSFNALRRGRTLGARMRGGRALGRAIGGAGSMGKVAGTLLSAVPVVGTFVKALMVASSVVKIATDALDKMSDAQMKHTHDLAQFSPAMAMIANQSNVQDRFRKMRQGAAQSREAKWLADARQRKKNAREGFDNWWERLKYRVSANWEDLKAIGWETANDVFGDSKEEKARQAKEREEKLERAVLELAAKMGATGEKIDALRERMRLTAEAERLGGHTFGSVAAMLGSFARERVDDAKDRLDREAAAARRRRLTGR